MISFDISNETIKKLKYINELAVEKKTLINSLDTSCREAIGRYARISSIGASTRIENAILTDTEIDWVDETLKKDSRPTAYKKEQQFIINKLSREKKRSIEEVVGYRDLLLIIYEQYMDLYPLSEAALKGFHRELLKYYPGAEYHLGNYKKVSNTVIEKIKGTKTVTEVLKTAEPGAVTETAMHDLLEWYNKTITSYTWAIAVSVEFVFRFLAIHPFQDGNGRLGRALFTLALLQSDDAGLKYTAPYLCIDRQIEKHKAEYYLTLRKCSDGKFVSSPAKYNYEPFFNFMLKMVKLSLENDIDYYINRYESYLSLSDAAQKVLKCFKEYPELRLQVKNITELTNIPKRTVNHSINTLLGKKFIQKTGSGPSVKYQLIF
ncbi:MAG: Fic family protein [Oligoflexia bacterium]|nr:Fic family protein [Oligoflexia bacterium]